VLAILNQVDAPLHEDLELKIRLPPPKFTKPSVLRIEIEFLDKQINLV
jgi:hypothetical protein